mmetsp:Transcript_7160/g.23627  ORF Transcript_7160/g.23627 Transcript_7160/m.23627 type:complete len:201 (+) Transcript_7160:1666-2268(+)
MGNPSVLLLSSLKSPGNVVHTHSFPSVRRSTSTKADVWSFQKAADVSTWIGQLARHASTHVLKPRELGSHLPKQESNDPPSQGGGGASGRGGGERGGGEGGDGQGVSSVQTSSTCWARAAMLTVARPCSTLDLTVSQSSGFPSKMGRAVSRTFRAKRPNAAKIGNWLYAKSAGAPYCGSPCSRYFTSSKFVSPSSEMHDS